MDHLSPEELGAYMSDALEGAERTAAELHLVSCRECRAEMIAAQGAVAGVRDSKLPSRRLAVFAGLAAAAAIAVVILPRGEPAYEPARVERSAPSETAIDTGALTIVSPSVDGQLENVARQFVWNASSGASYKITVTDSTGRPVWTANTGDTAIAIPSSVQLPPGGQFFWYVDALRSDGRSITSGINRFRAVR